jgi:hypothetical protein
MALRFDVQPGDRALAGELLRVLNLTKLSRQADHTIPFQSVTRILGTTTDNGLLLRRP